jgi:hypothetical protein
MNRHRSIAGLVTAVLSFSLSIVLAEYSSFPPNEPSNNGYDRIIEDHFQTLFVKGDTNAPLLAMDWFWGPKTVYECRVSKSGKSYNVRNCIDWALQGEHTAQLDKAHLDLLVHEINNLPPPPTNTPPQERWLVVRGIRHNQWFKNIYDRADVPAEVEKLYTLAGAYLEWFIVNIDAKRITQLGDGERFLSQLSFNSFSTARDVPIAISAGDNGIFVWNLTNGTVQNLLSDKILPINQQYGNTATISPDGNIIVAASDYGVYGMDLKNRKLLWTSDALEHEGGWRIKHLAIGGDHGQFLFAAGTHTLERWDLATGQKLAVLAANQPIIKYLRVSRDGKIVLAGIDERTSTDSTTSLFKVWNAKDDKPTAQITTPFTTGVGITPDGQTIVFSGYAQNGFRFWNWKEATTNEIPLRAPYGSSMASELFWSPDKTKFVAYVNTRPQSIVVFETLNWKPLGQWKCGMNMSDAKFEFSADGRFIELRGNVLSALDMPTTKTSSH